MSTTKTVTLERSAQGYGFSVVGGEANDTKEPLLPLVISKIIADSPAAKCGLRGVGDRLLEINGQVGLCGVGGVGRRGANCEVSRLDSPSLSPFPFRS